jgi:hypothetical protein
MIAFLNSGKGRALCFGLATLAIGTWVTSNLRIPDPVYSGKRLSVWLSEAPRNNATPESAPRLPDLDERAVPLLLKTLEQRPEFSERIQAYLPLALQKRFGGPGLFWGSAERRGKAYPAEVFLRGKPQIASNYLPEAYRLTMHPELGVRLTAAYILGKNFTNSLSSTNFVLNTLNHTDLLVRSSCLRSLTPVPTNAAVLSCIQEGLESKNLWYKESAKVASELILKQQSEFPVGGAY